MTNREFSARVKETARRIPPGYVLSYGRLAALAGFPSRARGAGFVMRSCQDASVPCHRVVFADGKLTEEGIFPEPGQRALLEAEGVLFLPDGRVDMPRCLWL